MRKTSIGIFLGAVGFGCLAVLALHRVLTVGAEMERASWASAQESRSEPSKPGEAKPKPAEDLTQLKKEILEAGDLLEYHHLIYEKVGEERWESEVKPKFVRDVAARVIFDQGTVTPSPDEIKSWMREHRAEVRQLLEDAAR